MYKATSLLLVKWPFSIGQSAFQAVPSITAIDAVWLRRPPVIAQ